MILDGSRITGPISQVTPLSAEHLRLLSGTELTGVDYSVYDYGGQYDSVLGWRLVLLVDRDSGLPVIWAIVPASVHESRVLLDLLLPQLFELWPDCPLHTDRQRQRAGLRARLRRARGTVVHPPGLHAQHPQAPDGHREARREVHNHRRPARMRLRDGEAHVVPGP